MCFSGNCRYEQHSGDCSIPFTAPIPPDALCVFKDFLEEKVVSLTKHLLYQKIGGAFLTATIDLKTGAVSYEIFRDTISDTEGCIYLKFLKENHNVTLTLKNEILPILTDKLGEKIASVTLCKGEVELEAVLEEVSMTKAEVKLRFKVNIL